MRTGDQWYVALKNLAQNTNIKIITGERAISGKWYSKNAGSN